MRDNREIADMAERRHLGSKPGSAPNIRTRRLRINATIPPKSERGGRYAERPRPIEQPVIVARQLDRLAVPAKVFGGRKMQGIQGPQRNWPRFERARQHLPSHLELLDAC